MEFKYVGKEGSVMFRGIAFVKGEYTEVPEGLVARLDENLNFKRKPGKKSDDA